MQETYEKLLDEISKARRTLHSMQGHNQPRPIIDKQRGIIDGLQLALHIVVDTDKELTDVE